MPYVLRGIDVATGSTGRARAARMVCVAALAHAERTRLRRRRRRNGLDLALGARTTRRPVARPRPCASTDRPVRSPQSIRRLRRWSSPPTAGACGARDRGDRRSPVRAPSATSTASRSRVVDRDGSVVLPDAFPGGYWDPYTLEPDTGGVWFAGAKRAPALRRSARPGRSPASRPPAVSPRAEDASVERRQRRRRPHVVPRDDAPDREGHAAASRSTGCSAASTRAPGSTSAPTASICRPSSGRVTTAPPDLTLKPARRPPAARCGSRVELQLRHQHAASESTEPTR